MGSKVLWLQFKYKISQDAFSTVAASMKVRVSGRASRLLEFRISKRGLGHTKLGFGRDTFPILIANVNYYLVAEKKGQTLERNAR